jgi:predicted small lipoprotein YifL
MNNILKTFAVLSTVAALAACQKAPNKKPQPQAQAQAQNGGVDKLASKPSGDVLAEKYKSLSATCELRAATAAEATPVDSVADANPVPPPATEPAPEVPPVPQPVVNGLNFSYDVKEQARIDSAMKKTLKVTLQPADAGLKVVLALRPVEFDSPPVEAVGSIRRLRKHSPYMAVFADVSQVAADGTVGEPTVTFIKLRESIQEHQLLAGSNLVLSCMLSGEIAKPEYKNQNLDIDCTNLNPPEDQREFYRANCQPVQAEEVPPAK